MPDALQEDTQERPGPRIGEDTTDVRGLHVRRPRSRPTEPLEEMGHVVAAATALLTLLAAGA